MEMAVRVGFPLAEEVYGTGVGPCAESSQPVVDRVVEVRPAFEMHPFDATRVKVRDHNVSLQETLPLVVLHPMSGDKRAEIVDTLSVQLYRFSMGRQPD